MFSHECTNLMHKVSCNRIFAKIVSHADNLFVLMLPVMHTQLISIRASWEGSTQYFAWLKQLIRNS